jgi:hypothetical protein
VSDEYHADKKTKLIVAYLPARRTAEEELCVPPAIYPGLEPV